ncbi:hypothetical protein JCM1393_09990 [Clostridium carnis]
MLERLTLSEEDYDYLAKGIALGVGCGILVGGFTGNVILTFAAGGVIGILGAFIYSFYRKSKNKN